MRYVLEYKPDVEDAIARLLPDDQRRVVAALESLAENPRPRGALKLQGKYAGQYRIRVGNFRIIYQIHDRRLVVVVVKVGPRDKSYR